MQSTIVYPMSVMQALRVYLDHPMYQLFQDKHQELAFDLFLSKVTFVMPVELSVLSEGQVHDLVALWVRTRIAAQRVGETTDLEPVSSLEVVRRLAVLDRFANCLPDVSGLLSEAYWDFFVPLCIEQHSARFEFVQGA